MSQPWLRPSTGATVRFGEALRRVAGSDAPRTGPWRTGTEAEVATATATPARPAIARCAACAELAHLRAELDAARAEAIEDGRRAGQAETAALRERLTAAVTAVDALRGQRDDAIFEQVVDLTLGLCAELAPAAAAIDRRGLVQLVARSLADAGGARELALQVCAADAAVIGTQLPAGMKCTIRPELVAGEVWVEAPRLVVDGRWATRLAALREPLIAMVRAAEPAFELATPRGDA